jgi:hypothetical protein
MWRKIGLYHHLYHRAEQLISQLVGVPEGISSAGSVDCQQGYLIHDLRSGDGEEGLIFQPGGTSKGSSSANLDSNIDCHQDYITCDLCNGNGDEPCNIPEGRSSARLDSNVHSQQGYVTCDVCNGSGYLMHGLPITRKVHLC